MTIFWCFIDYFLFQCKVYCIRVIFLYQKVFHTFMCSIDCTAVQYHTMGIDNQSPLLLSSLLLRGRGLNDLLPNRRRVACVCVGVFFIFYYTRQCPVRHCTFCFPYNDTICTDTANMNTWMYSHVHYTVYKAYFFNTKMLR